MDVYQSDLFENTLMKNENPITENIIHIDSTEDKNTIHSDITMTKHILDIHTPSPMVTRSCFSGTNYESWKSVSIYYSRNDNPTVNCTINESENKNAFNHNNIYGLYNVIDENKSTLQQNWNNFQLAQSCSPEPVRRNDIIIEENITNDNNENIDYSDYSDRSQSPVNSVSSNDSIGSSSSSGNSGKISPEQTIVQDTTEISPDTFNSQIIEQKNRLIDFQFIFFNNSDDEIFNKRYHQLPKAIDREAAKRLARRLYDCDGFKITDVAKHLSKRNDFSQIVGEEFSNFFDFRAMRLDIALRLFLSKFTLTGDTQERERIMHHFSKRYVECNGDIYNGEDACHTLVCALIILNTNLHSQAFPKMSSTDFLNNLKELNDGDDFPKENLEALFAAIEKEPIRDDELVGIVNVNKSDMMDMSKQMINTAYTMGMDEPGDSNSRDFMSGYVVRKWLKEPGGRRTSFGKRGWKLFHGRLRDLIIYLYKDHDRSYSQPKIAPKRQNSIKKSQPKASKHAKKSVNSNNNNNVKLVSPTNTDEKANNDDDGSVADLKQSVEINKENHKSKPDSADTNKAQNIDLRNEKDLSLPTLPTVIKTTVKSVEAISSKSQSVLILPPADDEIHIHHAFASKAIDYVKKKHVFRIKTKYGSEYLFQVNNEKEMESWIDNINYVAALLSDPEPIIGINTMEKLSSNSIPRPRITTLNVRNQLESHQKCVLELEKIISNLKENPPKKLEKKSLLEFDESIKFREDELLRYKTYCQLLEFEIAKLQNLTTIRCIPSGGDAQFFCHPYQSPGINQSIMLPNQSTGVNQQFYNGISSADGYVPNSVVFSHQPNLRFRSPVLHNFVTVPNNKRLRYRAPVAPILQSLVPAVTSCSASEQTTPNIAVKTENSRDTLSSPTSTTKTFYEIV